MQGKLKDEKGLLKEQLASLGMRPDDVNPELYKLISETYDQLESRLAVKELTMQQASEELKAVQQSLDIYINNSRQAEDMLRNANERYEFALLATSDAIWDWNLITDQIHWSGVFNTLFGYEAGLQSVSSSWKEKVHPGDYDRVFKGLMNVISNKSNVIWGDEYRFRKADGNYAYVYDRGYIIFNESGAPVRMVGAMQDITNRRSSEERIRQSEARMAEAQHIARFGTWEFTLSNLSDFASNKLFWSEEVFRIFEQPLDFNLTPQSFLQTIHPDDRENVKQSVLNSVKSRTRYVIDHRIILPDGTQKWVHEEAGILYEDDVPVKLVGMVQDITERKVAEEKLLNAHREYQILFETIDEVFFSVDVQPGKLTQISKACYHVYGYTQEEFLSDRNLWNAVVLPQDRNLLKQFDDELLTGNPVVQQYRIRHKNGSTRWVEVKVVPGLVNGRLLRLDGVARDITQSKQMQLELVESEKHNRNIFEQASIGMVLAKMNGDLVVINTAYADIIGYTLEEAQKLSYWDITPPEYFEIEKQKLEELTNNGRYKAYEKEYIHKNGERVAVKMSGVIISKDSEQYILSSVEDITESRRHKNDIIAKNAELEKTNAELDKFVYSVSHDLRAPLCSILGIIELTEEEVQDEFTIANLELIKSGIQRLDSFIHDILDYSRNSRTDVKRDPVDFRALINESVESVKYAGADKQGTPVINIHMNDQPPFFGDPGRLSMILNNLISNAVRYRKTEGDCIINVNVNVQPDSASISIADNGIGIQEKFLDKIFEMFFRVSEKSVGSGLGLYIVKEAVEKLNGTINVKSREGEGTEFIISIPNVESE